MAKFNSETLYKEVIICCFKNAATNKRIWLLQLSLFVPLPLPAPESAPDIDVDLKQPASHAEKRH